MTTISKTSRILAQRVIFNTNKNIAIRAFSNECEAARRIRTAIAEYREQK